MEVSPKPKMNSIARAEAAEDSVTMEDRSQREPLEKALPTVAQTQAWTSGTVGDRRGCSLAVVDFGDSRLTAHAVVAPKVSRLNKRCAKGNKNHTVLQEFGIWESPPWSEKGAAPYMSWSFPGYSTMGTNGLALWSTYPISTAGTLRLDEWLVAWRHRTRNENQQATCRLRTTRRVVILDDLRHRY